MVHKLAPRADSEENIADSVVTPTHAAKTPFVAADPQQRFFQSTIDALPMDIAVLNGCGDIVAVNRAWRENSKSRCVRMLHGSVSDCYYAQCDDVVISGIRAVLSGAQDDYAVEHHSGDRDAPFWFSLRVASLDHFATRHAVVTHEDITRRVVAEQARNETSLTLDTLAQAAPLAIIALDNDNRVTAWNPAAEEMFGWTEAEVLGKFNPLVPETAVPQFFDIVANLDNDAVDLTGVELQRQRKDGVVLDVSSSIAALRTADGQIRGSMAVLTDITERKRAQEAQRFLAEVSELLAASIDYETTLAKVARMSVPRLADICMVHLLDKDMSIRRLAIAHADPVRQKLAQRLQDHGPLRMDESCGVPVVLRTGQPVLYREMPSVVSDFDQERPGHMAIIRELGISSAMFVPLIAREQTIGSLAFIYSDSGRVYSDQDLDLAMDLARRAATAIDNAHLHHEVRRAELRLRTLVEHVPATSYTALADNLTAMTYVSPQVAEPDGPTAEDLINDPDLWTSFLHPDDIERVQKTLADCTTSGEPLAIEYRTVNSDGKVTWQYDRATLIHDERGQPLFWQGICVDITERKHAEEEREGLLRDLGERVKELTVLHQAAALFQSDSHSVPEILGELATMLPHGMQYPDVAVARVSLGALERASPEYQQAPWNIQGRFSAADGVSGSIEVGYRERCWETEDPFLPEESSLISTIADMLGGHLQRLDTQAELHRSEKRFRAAAEGSLDVFFILETLRSDDAEIVDYRFADMNTRGEEFLGHARDDVVGRKLSDFIPADHFGLVFEMFNHVATTGGAVERAFQIAGAGGVMRWLHHQAVPLADGVAVSVRDISDRKQLEEQLTHQAFHDALTGLPNRALFLDRVQHAHGRVRHRHEGVAVLFMDLDNFKFVNDSLGHSVGDRLLVAVAGRLSDCLGNDSAARLGGDEFAILLEDLADWAVATNTAERIGAAFQTPFNLSGREIFISPSIGVAFGACLDTTAEDLLRDADAAMYRAKRNGKARYEVFDPSLTVHALQRFELENDLRGAIERGEFRLHYQPILDLSSGNTIAVEALVRWEHPLHGLMPPLDFIPIAEDTGLIVPIGRWVLEEACQQVSAWNRQREGHRPLELGVNLSRRQFHDPDLSVHLAAAIDASGLDPHLLNVEITESVMIEDESMASETLQRLKALGVQLVIDDFGTGYSSLGMLRNFPVDMLKIDREFVKRLETNADDRVLVSGIISLAHALHLLVAAEGIETLEQLEQLNTLGCDFAQGFFIGRPLPADELSGAGLL